MICAICGKEIPENERYACLWEEEKSGLCVSFAHLQCSEGYQDITEEVTGQSYKEP